jgi:hypothetical protein
MAVFSSGVLARRRWFITLTLLAAIGTIAAGATLWQAMSLTSLEGVTEQIRRSEPLAGGIRFALILLLAVAWPWLQQIRYETGGQYKRADARWVPLRWRVVGWLIIIELVLGQDLVGHFLGAIAGRNP